MGNIITVVVMLITGIFAFNRIVNTLGAGLKDQSASIALLAAHQDASVALLAQSVTSLERTVVAMQTFLGEQQKQLNSMSIETEISRRLREGHVKNDLT
jgi:hypothetical protein